MYLKKCTEDQWKSILGEFNINEESLKKDVLYLIEWIEKQPHLPNVTDEIFIAHLLIQCKNSIEKTKSKLDSYYSVKAALPTFFTNRDPTIDEYKTAFNIACAVPLPKLTPEAYQIFIYKIFDPEKADLLTPESYLKLNFLNYDLIAKVDCNRKIILIYEFENMSVCLANTTFNAYRKYLSVIQDLYSFRIHQVHTILRLNPTISTLTNLVKKLLRKKIAEKWIIWKNERPDFTTLFPAEILPEDYGGKEESLDKLHKMYYEYVCSFRDWLKSEEDIKADLSKKTEDFLKNSVDESVDGSFRQLIID